MQILNLIRPEISHIKYDIIQFPDGEPHIVLKDIDRKREVTVICRVCNPTDLFILMQVGDILNRQGVIFCLEIAYLMSMRMDRVMSYNESYSLSVVTKVINDMFPKAVHMLEPHSKKVGELIEEYWGDIATPMPDFEGYLRVAPDAGAVFRYGGREANNLVCSKVIDVETGRLSGFKVENPEILDKYPDSPLVVIDDLCDGGGTFAGIAEEIKKIANRKLSIYVTHMVNPKGIETLSKHYDEVYFTNSYKDWDKELLPENVQVIKVV